MKVKKLLIIIVAAVILIASAAAVSLDYFIGFPECVGPCENSLPNRRDN